MVERLIFNPEYAEEYMLKKARTYKREMTKTFYEFCMENEDKKHLLDEWDYEYNYKIAMYVDEIGYASSKNVWWICEHGHTWQAPPERRTKKNGSGCPYCSGRKAWAGFNDLATTHPELAKEWHPTKNGDLKPTQVTAGSHKKVWWICEKGHDWETTLDIRKRGNGCPYCAGQKVWVGFNDLNTTHPEIAKEWHPTKNGDLKPTEVPAGSPKNVWWKCKHGHEWEKPVARRTYGKLNCPYCSNYKIMVGCNDLATTYPEIAKEWHPTKNGDLKPTDVVAGTDKKVWWICKHGHDFKSSIVGRTHNGNGCPYCAGKKVWVGFNDLVTTHPEIAKEWHPTKNGDLLPTMVTAGSSKKEIWWQCKHGHEWKNTTANRTSGSGCPVCSNHKILVGKNDLATTHPEIAKEWHPTKNGDLKPTDVVAGTDKKVWWICKHGHSFESRVVTRTHRGYGCPYCAGQKISTGFNDFPTTCPELLKYWDFEKNTVSPTEVTKGSHKKYHWTKNGESYCATPSDARKKYKIS